MLTMLAGFAEFERNLIRERQREGIVLAKAKGDVYLGRAKALTDAQAKELRQRAGEGWTKARLADTYGISRTTVYQYLGPTA